MSRVAALVLACVAPTLVACDTDDIGTICEGMVIADPGHATTDGDVMTSRGSEIVEYNVTFPCENTVCIATLGRGGYCTRECSIRGSNCPSAFECREVLSIGPFAGETFCAWKECTFSEDCGDVDKYACTEVKELSLGKIVRLCALR
ncbi:MAG: hypothetical protein V3T05_03285 [Myxococcota bacterium]